MVNAVLIEGLPERISSNALRKDLGDLIRSHNGNRRISTKGGGQLQEIYEIPEKGALIVVTSDDMRFKIDVDKIITDGQVTARDQALNLNALVLLMGFKPDESYSRLYQDLSDLPQKYK